MAYKNKTYNDGQYDTYMADPGGSTIPAYRRCKFVVASPSRVDGRPMLQLCSATERADIITMQPIAAGAIGNCRYVNGGGSVYGAVVPGAAAITDGVLIYGAANGQVTGASGGGAVVVGKTTSPGVSAGVLTYAPVVPLA
jgi:hypothetical protein